MNKIKTYTRSILEYAIIFLAYILILTILNYTKVLPSTKIVNINFIIISILSFIIGIRLGIKAPQKGYIKGLKSSSIIILVLFILNIILYRTFSLSMFIYYLVIMFSTTIGSILGINIHKKK